MASIWLLASLALVSMVEGINLTGTVYSSIAHSACYREMHSQGGVGCWAPKKGTAGVLRRVSTSKDLDDLLAEEGAEKTAVLMPASMLTGAHLKRMNDTTYVAGVLVEPDEDAATGAAYSFSPGRQDAATDMASSSSSSSSSGGGGRVLWNPGGTGASYETYRFPVVLISAASNDTAVLRSKLAEAGSATGATGATAGPGRAMVRFDLWFGPSRMDSVTCLGLIGSNGQQACDPTGGQSAWATFGPVSRSIETVVLAATMDSLAFFPEKAFGANAAASGLIAALAAADALGKVPGVGDLPRRIMVMAFQGEARARVGSRRFVADVEAASAAAGQGKPWCTRPVAGENSTTRNPLCIEPAAYSRAFEQVNLSTVAHVIGLDQLAIHDPATPQELYLHQGSPTGTAVTGAADQALQAAATAAGTRSATDGTGLPVRAATPTTPPSAGMPPSPVQAFQASAAFKGGAALLTAYDKTFAGRNYHGRLDAFGAEQYNATAICAAATVAARTAYALAAGSSSSAAVQASCDVVDALVDCFQSGLNCSLADNLGYTNGPYGSPALPTLIDRAPISLYSSVFRHSIGEYGAPVNAYGPRLYYYPGPWFHPVEDFTWRFLANATFAHSPLPLARQAAVVAGGPRHPACDFPLNCTAGETCLASRCVPATAHYHAALSPLLRYNVSSGLFVTDGLKEAAKAAWPEDPLWTEPRWAGYTAGQPYEGFRVQVYIADSLGYELGIFFAGIFVLLASAGIAKLASKMSVRFKID